MRLHSRSNVTIIYDEKHDKYHLYLKPINKLSNEYSVEQHAI